MDPASMAEIVGPLMVADIEEQGYPNWVTHRVIRGKIQKLGEGLDQGEDSIVLNSQIFEIIVDTHDFKTAQFARVLQLEKKLTECKLVIDTLEERLKEATVIMVAERLAAVQAGRPPPTQNVQMNWELDAEDEDENDLTALRECGYTSHMARS